MITPKTGTMQRSTKIVVIVVCVLVASGIAAGIITSVVLMANRAISLIPEDSREDIKEFLNKDFEDLIEESESEKSSKVTVGATGETFTSTD